MVQDAGLPGLRLRGCDVGGGKMKASRLMINDFWSRRRVFARGVGCRRRAEGGLVPSVQRGEGSMMEDNSQTNHGNYE